MSDDWTPKTEAERMLKDELDGIDRRAERIQECTDVMFQVIRLINYQITERPEADLSLGGPIGRMVVQIMNYVERGE
jgi:hypothetical protein